MAIREGRVRRVQNGRALYCRRGRPGMFKFRRDLILNEARIRTWDVGFWKTVLSSNNIGALRSCGAFIESDHPVSTLTTKAAI